MSIKSQAKKLQKKLKKKLQKKKKAISLNLIKSTPQYDFKNNEFNTNSVLNKIKEWRKIDQTSKICSAKIFDFDDISEELLFNSDKSTGEVVSSILQQLMQLYSFKTESDFKNFKYQLSFYNSNLNINFKKDDNCKQIKIPFKIKQPIELEFPMGFPTYNNCIFVCSDAIFYIFSYKTIENMEYWALTMWLKGENNEPVVTNTMAYMTTQIGTTLYYNPMNFFISDKPLDIETHAWLSSSFIAIIKLWTLLNQRKPITYIQTQGKGRHKSNTNSQESEIIKIDINPNINRVMPISNNRSSGIKKKYHEVATHTRRYKSGKVVQVKSHYRGDPSLGVSNKIYKVVDTSQMNNLGGLNGF